MKESVRVLSRRISELRSQGMRDAEIKRNLGKLGASRELIAEAFAHTRKSQNTGVVDEFVGRGVRSGAQAQTHRRGPAFFLVFIFFVIGLATILVVLTTPSSCGGDLACFVAKANVCESATLRTEIKGVSFSFYTDDCRVTKRAGTVFYDNRDLQRVLRGKSMDCNYGAGAFDQSLVQNLGGDLDSCHGEYKNALVALAAV